MANFSLRIKPYDLGVMELVEWVSLVGYSLSGGVYVKESVKEVKIDNKGTEVLLADSLLYQIKIVGKDKTLLSASFTMPSAHVSLTELKLLKSSGVDGSLPIVSPIVYWGDIMGDITKQKDLTLGNGTVGKDGESAYQIAKRLGKPFTETEAIWLASLQGKAGENGINVDRTYATYSIMYAAKDTIPANTKVEVVSDSTLSFNGVYVYDGLDFTKAKTIANKAVKFLTRAELGLTHDAIKKAPPYTDQDHIDAHNHTVNIVNAAKQASLEGYSSVVLERGTYSSTYSNSNSTVTYNTGIAANSIHAWFDGLTDITINFNGSEIYSIFDSEVRAYYDKSTVLQPYDLSGAVFGIRNCINTNFIGWKLEGEQKFRKWVLGTDPTKNGERFCEQTYGFWLDKNNINIKFDGEGSQFRGDVISGNVRGDSIFNLTGSSTNLDGYWFKGGIDLLTGTENTQVGAYRTKLITLSDKNIKRNAVQLMTTGVMRAAEFREEFLSAIFYDATGKFLWTEKITQAEFIYLPKDTASMRLVAYGDERTDPQVTYGQYLFLATGTSEHTTVKGNFYQNFRGALSNLTGYTTVDFTVNDGGILKNQKPTYDDETRYAINFEDIFLSRLKVTGSISNCNQGVLCNGRRLICKDLDFKNIYNYAVGAFATFVADISGCSFSNVKNVLDTQKTSARKKNRIVNFYHNTIKDSGCYMNDLVTNNDTMVNITDNHWYHSYIRLNGSGSNLMFDRNTFHSIGGKGIFEGAVHVIGALTARDNIVSRLSNIATSSIGWAYFNIDAQISKDNLVVIKQPEQRVLSSYIPRKVERLSGTNFLLEFPIDIELLANTGSLIGVPDIREVLNSSFKGNALNIGIRLDSAQLTNFCEIDYTFVKTKFSDLASIVLAINEVSVSGFTHKITFEECEFDVTNMDAIIKNPNISLKNPLVVKFIECKFRSKVDKTIPFFTGITTNITATQDRCTYVRVTNSDSVLAA